MIAHRKDRPLYWGLFFLACLALTAVLYGRALTLPFFFDDFVHYPFVEANSLARIWLTLDELAYYRPLNFSIWRLTYDLFQGHNPQVDHGLNLLLHTANGFLVGWLAARLWSATGREFPELPASEKGIDWWRACLAGALFLLFPFSYQAVPWVGSMSHLLVTSLILLSLACYVHMRHTRLRGWGVISLAFAALAPFAHENGVLVAPLVAAIELTTPQLKRRWTRAFSAGLIWSLPLLLYLPIWLALPRAGSDTLLPNNVEGLLQNTAYFVQGIFAPLTAQGGWLFQHWGVNDMVAIGFLSAAGALLAAAVQLIYRATLRSWLPWIWCLLASLPAIIFLLFEYVINGPRLLMLVSVGVAWLWADVALLFARGGAGAGRRRTLRAALAGAVMLLVLWQSSRFIEQRMDLHQSLGRGFDQVLEATAEAGRAGQAAVVLNFPSWFASRTPVFALGHEGVLFWPDYVPPAIFLAVHGAESGNLTFARADAVRPDLAPYYYGLTGPAADWRSLSAAPAQIWLTEYDADRLTLREVGMLNEGAEPDGPHLARFISLDGATVTLLAAETSAQGDGLRLDLWWQIDRPVTEKTVFVHLLGPDGQLLAQADGDPLGGGFPFELWIEGDIVRDTRLLPATAVPPAGINVGLYDRLSGERLNAFDSLGELWPDGAANITLVE